VGVQGGEIERQRKRYGGIYRYKWRGKRKGIRFLTVDALIAV